MARTLSDVVRPVSDGFGSGEDGIRVAMSTGPEGDEGLQAAGEPRGAGLEAVRCHEDLVKLLVEQFARADLSLRELQARTERLGGARLPRATCADMLAGRRFPRKEVMMAFLRACQVPERQLPAWERAWERVRIAQMTAGPGKMPTREPAAEPAAKPAAEPAAEPAIEPAVEPVGKAAAEPASRPAAEAIAKPAAEPAVEPVGKGTTEPASKPVAEALGGPSPVDQEPVSPEAAVRGPAPGRRKAALSAVLTALATVVVLGVVLGQRATPQGSAAEARPDRADGLDHTVRPGHIVSDDGRAFGLGGSSRFTVTVDPANTGVRLTRRLDVGVPLQHATITVNGAPAGVWRPLLGDTVYKWRNQVVTIPPALTAGKSSLTIVNTFVSSSLGFNEFLYVVEHRVNGVWSIADVVDIGPASAASEAAHDYRIVAEGWADTQTFAYPPREEDWSVE